MVAIERQPGRPAIEVLSEALPDWIAALRFDKSMRWNDSNVAFARPIRWLLALYGRGERSQVVPFEYAGLHSGDATCGLRFRQPERLQVDSPEVYFEALEAQGILLDPAARRAAIQLQVEALAAEVGGMVPADPALLAEVTNLVEAPTATRGAFDGGFLKLPREVLISVMKKHQRYFPLVRAAVEDFAS